MGNMSCIKIVLDEQLALRCSSDLRFCGNGCCSTHASGWDLYGDLYSILKDNHLCLRLSTLILDFIGL